MTRIVYVHQAICLAFFAAGLKVLHDHGLEELVGPHLLGIVLATAVLFAMFGVATQKSVSALTWLRIILWTGVIKVLVVQGWLLAQGTTALTSYLHALVINELIAVPLAVYWSRPVHRRYLTSLRIGDEATGPS